jgi:hypothetical protein
MRYMIAIAGAALLAATPAASAVFVFDATMNGATEVPPNASPATGFSEVTYDSTTDALAVDLTWAGLIGGNPAASHIHCCSAPGTNVNVALAFAGFPATTSGSYFHVFNLLDPSVYTTSFLTNFGGGTAAGARTALVSGMIAGEAYTNIHNSVFPGGEIRGQLAPVPEPASWVIMIAGFGLLGGAFRIRRRVVARS